MLCLPSFAARFHAIYGHSELVVQISPLRIIAGEAPEPVRARVLEWAQQHQQELLAAWNRCCLAQRPLPIPPLP